MHVKYLNDGGLLLALHELGWVTFKVGRRASNIKYVTKASWELSNIK